MLPFLHFHSSLKRQKLSNAELAEIRQDKQRYSKQAEHEHWIRDLGGLANLYRPGRRGQLLAALLELSGTGEDQEPDGEYEG